MSREMQITWVRRRHCITETSLCLGKVDRYECELPGNWVCVLHLRTPAAERSKSLMLTSASGISREGWICWGLHASEAPQRHLLPFSFRFYFLVIVGLRNQRLYWNLATKLVLLFCFLFFCLFFLLWWIVENMNVNQRRYLNLNQKCCFLFDSSSLIENITVNCKVFLCFAGGGGGGGGGGVILC